MLVLEEETKSEWQGWVWCQANDAREVDVAVGEAVRILREEKGWAWVQKNDGADGWIPVENLEL